jgi:hypothetical protein
MWTHINKGLDNNVLAMLGIVWIYGSNNGNYFTIFDLWKNECCDEFVIYE